MGKEGKLFIIEFPYFCPHASLARVLRLFAKLLGRRNISVGIFALDTANGPLVGCYDELVHLS